MNKQIRSVSKKISSNPLYLLIPVFILSLIIRFWFLSKENVNFGYDQGRDAFVIKEMLDGNLKILGPPTSGTPGLFHGVLFYYLIAPAYFLGGGNPMYAVYLMAFINALTIFPVFYLTYYLSKKHLPAFLSAFLFTVSFDAIQFSNLLSNVSLAILFIPVMVLGLYLWIKKKNRFGPLITGLGFGLTVQSEVAFALYLLPIVSWLLVYKKNIKKKEIITFVTFFVLSVATMVIAEIKFSFPAAKGLIYLFSSKDGNVTEQKFSEFLIVILDQIANRFSSLLYPFNISFGALLGFVMVFVAVFAKKFKTNEFNWSLYLLSFMLAHIIAIPFGGSITPYIMIGAVPLLTVFLAIFIWKLSDRKYVFLYVVLFFLTFLNLSKFVLKNNSDKPDYFTNDYLISNEKSLVDYTYEKADYKPFSISTLTSPLNINTLWSYLYNWYGMGNYGYLPYWRGRDQVDLLGNNLQKPPEDVLTHFFIMEPSSLIPPMWVEIAVGEQDSFSDLVSESRYGDIIVQERQIRTSR